ncbi:MAG: hypothetical protein ABJD11_17535 [Gemmatimonadota bacterium]
MRTRTSVFLALAVVAASACDTTSPAGDAGSALAPRTNAASIALAFPDNARPYGTSTVDWSVNWWRWALSAPTAVNPILDLTGADCGVGQQGPVWYLASIITGSGTRTCTIPHGKALGINLSGILNDYPCPDPNFHPAPGESLQEFLTAGAKGVVDLVDGLTLTVDGQSVEGLFARRNTSRLIHFTGDSSLQTSIDGCITGTEQSAVVDGYFIILKPLAGGSHSITFTASDTHGVMTSVTWNLVVESEG